MDTGLGFERAIKIFMNYVSIRSSTSSKGRYDELMMPRSFESIISPTTTRVDVGLFDLPLGISFFSGKNRLRT